MLKKARTWALRSSSPSSSPKPPTCSCPSPVVGAAWAPHIRLGKANRDMLTDALHTAWKLRVDKNFAQRARPSSTILCLTDRGKNGQWIDARAVHPDSPVEMRTCHAPRRANSSDRLPLGSQLALMNIHHRKMCE